MNIDTTPSQALLTLQPQRKGKCLNPTYKKLKLDLITICQKIEESFNLILQTSQEKKKESQTNSERKNDQKELTQLINQYKTKTKDAEIQLEAVYKMGRILEIEQELQSKENEYTKLKNENDTLNSIRVHHVKGLEEYQNKILKRNEIVSLNEKIKKTKEETKIKRNYYRTTESQIKGQLNQIKVLEEKCRIIKENIEYRKEKARKDIENSIKKNEHTLQNGNNDEYLFEEDVDKLKQMAKMNEENFFQFEYEYKKAIEEQRTQIERLKDEIKILSIKIKEVDQEKKIQELKRKETKKKEEYIQLQKNQMHQNFKRKFNNNFKSLKNQSTINNANFSMNKKYNKPFEINKLLNDQNMLKSQPTNKDPTLLQIEQLKSEIQKAISLNDHQLNTELDKPSQQLLNNITEIKHVDNENYADNSDDINLSHEINYDNI